MIFLKHVFGAVVYSLFHKSLSVSEQYFLLFLKFNLIAAEYDEFDETG